MLPLLAAGICVGLFGEWALGRSLAALLYGVTPSDPVVLVTVLAFLVGVALLAISEPTRKAMHIDPRIALE